MNRTWLLIDLGSLAYRAFHSTGGKMSYGADPTGVAYGVLRDLSDFTELFQSTTAVICCDGGYANRLAICPDYKITRRTSREQQTLEESELYALLREEIRRLRDELLPMRGHKNVLQQIGYEADDIIAKVAKELPGGVDAVIISTDKDLWQCLSENVVCYNPIQKTSMTLKKFRLQYGIEPDMWASVKALAGCSSDDVKGIVGVGDITAARFYAGQLKKGSKAYQKVQAGLAMHDKNIGLVRLPFPGLDEFVIVEDQVTSDTIAEVDLLLGIRLRAIRKRAVLI